MLWFLIGDTGWKGKQLGLRNLGPKALQAASVFSQHIAFGQLSWSVLFQSAGANITVSTKLRHAQCRLFPLAPFFIDTVS